MNTIKQSDLVALGQRIVQLREVRKLTQEKMAHKIRITSAQYRNIENGAHNVSAICLIQIAHLLRVPLKELFTLVDKKWNDSE